MKTSRRRSLNLSRVDVIEHLVNADVIEHIEKTTPHITGNSNVWGCFLSTSHPNLYFQWNFFPAWSIIERTMGRKETGGNLDAEKRKK